MGGARDSPPRTGGFRSQRETIPGHWASGERTVRVHTWATSALVTPSARRCAPGPISPRDRSCRTARPSEPRARRRGRRPRTLDTVRVRTGLSADSRHRFGSRPPRRRSATGASVLKGPVQSGGSFMSLANLPGAGSKILPAADGGVPTATDFGWHFRLRRRARVVRTQSWVPSAPAVPSARRHDDARFPGESPTAPAVHRRHHRRHPEVGRTGSIEPRPLRPPPTGTAVRPSTPAPVPDAVRSVVRVRK
jgi:hypothetical protein